jgi:hypothetical protein
MSLPCSLNHNTLNSVRKKVGSEKLRWGHGGTKEFEVKIGRDPVWRDFGTRYRPLLRDGAACAL